MHRVGSFISLSPATEYSGIKNCLRQLRELNPKKAEGYLPIAETFSECQICIAYRGSNAGKVFFTVYKYKIADNKDMIPIDVTMEPLADSFADLLDYMIEIPNPYCRIEDLGKCGTAEDLAQYLAEGNSIESVGKHDLTILSRAIAFENYAMIQACIKGGASLSGSIKIAMGNEHIHLIEMLVKAGADINERDEWGNTPLHYIGGTELPGDEGELNRAMRRLLIKLGAIDPGRRVEHLGEDGTEDDLKKYLAEGNSIDAEGKEYGATIICEAIRCNNVLMVQACIKRGANMSRTIEIAVENKRTELIKTLVGAGADVNERDEFDSTPLYYAVGTDLPGEEGKRNRAMRRLLIKLGAVE